MMAPNKVLMSFSAHLAHVRTLASGIDPSLTVEGNEGAGTITILQGKDAVANLTCWEDDFAISTQIRQGMIELAEFNAKFIPGPTVEELTSLAESIHPNLQVRSFYGEPDDLVSIYLRCGRAKILLLEWDVRNHRVQMGNVEMLLRQAVDECLTDMRDIVAHAKK
jgi:hypothetical protein